MTNLLAYGIRTEDGTYLYTWYHLENQNQRFYRVAALRELSAVTSDPQEEADMLGKQWGAVRGLYNAGVDFLYTCCGIFTPQHIGIVQLYGAAASGDSENSAAEKASPAWEPWKPPWPGSPNPELEGRTTASFPGT